MQHVVVCSVLLLGLLSVGWLCSRRVMSPLECVVSAWLRGADSLQGVSSMCLVPRRVRLGGLLCMNGTNSCFIDGGGVSVSTFSCCYCVRCCGCL